MEFGQLDDINQVDWSIPAMPRISTQYLSQLNSQPGRLRPSQSERTANPVISERNANPAASERNANPAASERTANPVYLGAPAWGRKEWIGKIYPPGAKASAFLFHYSRAFGCIELNSSHYRIPNAAQTEQWLSQVPEDFRFCPKLAQSISHAPGGLKNPELLKEWFQFLESLKSHLGPSFAQFPPHFDYSRKSELFHFLQTWPDRFPLALEFRHPSWFQDQQILPALTEYLQTRNIGVVITDVAGRRDVAHSSVSADFTFIRWIGNNLHPSDEVRAQAWAKRLREWQDLGLQQVYLMIHEPDDVLAPDMAEKMAAFVSESLGIDLMFPR